MGDYAGARPYYEQALAIRREALGEQHPDTASSLNNLGMLLQAQGDYAGARPYYEQALAISQRSAGGAAPRHGHQPEQPGVSAASAGGLRRGAAVLRAGAGDLKEALGEQHPDTASSLNNLGALCYAEGDLAAAVSYFRQALVIKEISLGPEHPSTTTARTWSS